ncbi:MAG: hypothetical protein M3Y33_09895 [Actinomycetota bacterium]|nr:hypothetical protein [Actinomycetota bacterium]
MTEPDLKCPQCGRSASAHDLDLLAHAKAMDAALYRARQLLDGYYLDASKLAAIRKAISEPLAFPRPADGVPVLATMGDTEPKPPHGITVDLTKFRVELHQISPARVRVTHPDDGVYCAISVSFGEGKSPTLAEIIASFEEHPIHERADMEHPQ